MISERDEMTLDNEPICEDKKTPYAEIEKGSYSLFLFRRFRKGLFEKMFVKRSIRSDLRSNVLV